MMSPASQIVAQADKEILAAAKEGSIPRVTAALEAGADPNYVTGVGFCRRVAPLWFASIH